MKIRQFLAAASLAALAISGGCKQAESAPSAASITSDGSDWGNYMETFLKGYFPINPAFAIYQGRHEYDGQLADFSPAGLKAMIDYRKDAIAKAQAIDAGKLSDGQKFERQYLINTMQSELFWIEEADQPHKNPAYYVGALDPSVFIARPYADAETRMKAFIKYLGNIPAAAAQIKANLKLPLPATFVKYGQAGFGGFATSYAGDAKAAFASVKDSALQAEYDAAAAKAAAAMNDLADYVGSQPGTAGGFELGAATFANMVKKTEGVDIALPELTAIGTADLKRNQAALATICARYAPGATMQACMDKMSANKAADGPVAEARRQLPPIKAFLADKDLVSIPGTEEAKVEESPPYNRQNSAYIDIPGPFEKGLPSVYYISPPDPAWDKKTQDEFVPGKADLLGTSIHEIWPGHFLNFLHANRAESLFGRLFVGYGYAEGWAHYTEEMMVEAGLAEAGVMQGLTPDEIRIGQISNALLRDCRFISAIGLHSGTMSVEQSKQFFINECFQSEGTAIQQSARGTYDPAYLNYTLGKLMIKQLRDDWTKGDKTKWKKFHDAFLSYGGPQIPMVRQAMLKEAEAKAVFAAVD
jgi:uncharacterized protein (DUF885 family)